MDVSLKDSEKIAMENIPFREHNFFLKRLIILINMYMGLNYKSET